MNEIPEDAASKLMMDATVTGIAIRKVEADGTWARIAPEDFYQVPAIPADIRSAAARAVGPTIDPRGELATRVAEAILAERQRCAKVAEDEGQGWRLKLHGNADYAKGRCEAGLVISALIQGGNAVRMMPDGSFEDIEAAE